MEQVREKSWFSRNWGWVLGGGCLSLIVVVVLLFAGIFYKIADTVKQSDAYSHAYEKAIDNEKVVSLLGEPIETNGVGTSSFKYDNGLNTAELMIPIKGPKEEGVIIVDAVKKDNVWNYNKLYVVINGEKEKINLEKTAKDESLDDL